MIQANFITGSGGGGGVALSSVTGIATLVASRRVYVKWTDPSDVVVSGSTIAAWAGTKLVRKTGSTPTSHRDGTLVLDSKTRNNYSSVYFCDNDNALVDGVTYYYKFFPYTSDGVYTDSNADEFQATPSPVQLGNVSNISAAAGGNGKLAIKWTDPDATVVSDGVTLATWASTKVVVKASGYATGPDDTGAAWSYTSTTRNAYTSTALVATGLTNGVIHYISFFPISTDGTVNTNAVSGDVNRTRGAADRMTISTVPSQSGSLTYNGSVQSPLWNDYDDTKMVKSDGSGTNAGDYYNVSFTPMDDYKWSDGATTSKAPKWTIRKATGTLTVSKNSITLSSSKTSDTFTIGGNHDGTITVTSSNTSVVTVSRSGGTVTVSSVNNTTGTATITVSCTAGTNYTKPSDQTVSVTASFIPIYGVEWDGTSTTRLTRTDLASNFSDPVPYVAGASSYSSPFDNIMPWSGMASQNRTGIGKVVNIPRFWYKLTKTGSHIKIQIANQDVDGFSVSPAHMDRGDGSGERSSVSVGRYHCSSNYRSVTDAEPVANITRSAARTSIHNLFNKVWQMDFATRFTIWLLYIVEYADWDSQKVIGYGCGNGSAVGNTGYTDNMPYHTGTTQSSRTTYGLGTQYRYIEGLWDNVSDWLDGCYNNSNGLNVILNPSSFSDSSGGTLIGYPVSGWTTALSVVTAAGAQWFYPSKASGSSDTYIPDWYTFAGGSSPCMYAGGPWSHGLFYGLFCVESGSTSSQTIGCRLMYLP